MTLKAVVFEPHHSGHRLQYAAALLRELQQLGVDVFLATSSTTMRSTQASIHLDGLDVPICYLATSASKRPFWVYRHQVAQLYEIVADRGFQHVYVPYADGLSQAFGSWLRPTFDEGIVSEALHMRCSFSYANQQYMNFVSQFRCQASLHLTSRAPWSHVHLLDPLQLFWIRQHAPGFSRRCTLIPEAVEELATVTKHDARRALGIPEDGRYVVALGGLDSRKGIDLLIDAFLATDTNSCDRLLLMGEQSDEIRTHVNSVSSDPEFQKRVIVLDRYVDQESFELGFHCSDVIAATYRSHVGSSGVLVRAAKTKRPVLTSDWGWLGWATNKFRLGVACDIGSKPSLTEAIERVLEESTEFSPSENSQRFAQFHSIDNHLAHWTTLIRHRLGKPASKHLYAWDNVLATPTDDDSGLPKSSVTSCS